MSRLVQGGEIVQAIAASAMRAAQIGYDEAIVELGFEPDQVRAACRAQAIDFLRRVPINATLIELEASIGSAEVEGVIAGVRLGRLYSDRMSGEIVTELVAIERELREWYDTDTDLSGLADRLHRVVAGEAGEPCATCGYAGTCGDPPGEDCHS